ncbi:MAG TPA: hypothetical protein P5307_22380 [Pirellulaceae bacterium]|nr:hypothetical protein [Pirellulaceae bacterium]
MWVWFLGYVIALRYFGIQTTGLHAKVWLGLPAVIPVIPLCLLDGVVRAK